MVTDGERELTPRRRWLAIGVATVPLLFSYLTLAAALITTEEESPVGAGGAALGLGLVPFVFILLAFVSNHPQAPIAVLKAMGVFLLVALPIGLAAPVIGISLGYGAGGIMALRAHPEHPRKHRWIALGITAVYIVFLLFVSPPAGLFSGGVLPLLSLGFADTFSEGRARG